MSIILSFFNECNDWMGSLSKILAYRRFFPLPKAFRHRLRTHGNRSFLHKQASHDPNDPVHVTLFIPNIGGQAETALEQSVADAVSAPQADKTPAGENRLTVHRLPDRSRLDVLPLQRFDQRPTERPRRSGRWSCRTARSSARCRKDKDSFEPAPDRKNAFL